MGVPAFYKWLSTRYPKIVVDAIEEEPQEVDGVEIPVDGTKPNPNGECDNLYLDMNGIIHPCFHPEDRKPPTTATECFHLIFEYIDRVMNMARPRNVLYMAIDGVAPRAKMNQQRGRRFRSAKDAEEKLKEEDAIRDELRAEGIKVKEKEPGVLSELSDSNVITPGTPFMAKLSVALQYYIHMRLNTEPMWRNIKVILSDANVPGEGEHKIMQYIREQRNRKGWNPNTSHCIYGLDADLIMLALATHDPHFTVLREVVFFRNFEKQDHMDKKTGKKPHQFLKITILREYLAMELDIPNLPFPFDQERAIDDFVFLCFFVGNDFLPHSPTLEIREGGIDLLMKIYKLQLQNMGGYICDGPNVNLERVEVITREVAKMEKEILKMRMKKLQQDKSRRRNFDNHERYHSRHSGKQQQGAKRQRDSEVSMGRGRGRLDYHSGRHPATDNRYRYHRDPRHPMDRRDWGSRQSHMQTGQAYQNRHTRFSSPEARSHEARERRIPQDLSAFSHAHCKQNPGKEKEPVARASNKDAADKLREQLQGSFAKRKKRDKADDQISTGIEHNEETKDTTTTKSEGCDPVVDEDGNADGAEEDVMVVDSIENPVDEGEGGENPKDDVSKMECNDGAGSEENEKLEEKKLVGEGDEGDIMGDEEGELKEVLDGDTKEEVIQDTKADDKGVGDVEEPPQEPPHTRKESHVSSETAVVEEAVQQVDEEVKVEKLKESFDLKEKQEGEKLAVGTQVAKDSGGKDHEAMWAELANLGGIADYQLPSESKEGETEEKQAKLGEMKVQSRLKDKMTDKNDMFEEMVQHEEHIAFGEDGWKERYYRTKYPDVGDKLEDTIKGMVQSYVEGLCWVMAYYYDGVPSWRWYYPYHYSPFATDMVDIANIEVSFKLGEPFTPLMQLMGVLPAASRHCLPEPLQDLFVSDKSPIKEFYPKNFKCDMNGKRFAWMAVVLLPFIDEEKLLWACKPHLKNLEEEEKDRNRKKLSLMYFHGSCPLAASVHEMAHKHHGKTDEQKFKTKQPMDPEDSNGINGHLCLPSGDHCPNVMPAPYGLGDDVEGNQVICSAYVNPQHQIHQSRIMKGTVIKTGNVDSGDIPPEVPLWHENGRTPTDTRSHRSRQEQRARVAPDAARRIMQHHLGRNSQHPQHSQHHAPRQHMHFSNHAPPVPPNAVTMRALEMADYSASHNHPRHPVPPEVPPPKVTEAAIRLIDRTHQALQQPRTLHTQAYLPFQMNQFAFNQQGLANPQVGYVQPRGYSTQVPMQQPNHQPIAGQRHPWNFPQQLNFLGHGNGGSHLSSNGTNATQQNPQPNLDPYFRGQNWDPHQRRR